jgi:hypothetical protein
MEKTPPGASSAERRARIEAMIALYPDTTAEQLQELVHWFKHDATALDVGMVSSNPDIHEAYVQFRTQELDRLKVKDYALIAGVIGTLGAFLIYGVMTFA